MKEINWEELDFEEACRLLEEVVRLLEGGETTLEESLALFEQGIKLVRFCNECLTRPKEGLGCWWTKALARNWDLAQGGVG